MKLPERKETRPERIIDAIYSIWNTRGYQMLTLSTDAVTLTGSTAETVLATVKIPAKSLGRNGAIRTTALYRVTNSANNKTLRMRLGGLAGASMGSFITLNTLSARLVFAFQNQDNPASQVAIDGGGFGASASAILTGMVDTSVEQDLVLTGQLANGADSIVLESYTIEIYRRE